MRVKGFDILWVPDFDRCMQDEELLSLAETEKRILLTNDTDFGQIIYYQKRISTGIILFRIKGQVVKKKLKALNILFSTYQDQIRNSFIVISDRKIRIRSLESL